MIKMCCGLHVKCRLLFQILIKLEFSRQIFEKKIQISNVTEPRPLEAELFHAGVRTDRQTDRQTRRK
jgi:hypothetical protein